MKRALCIALLCAVLLSSCAPSKLDASIDEALLNAASLDMIEHLSAGEYGEAEALMREDLAQSLTRDKLEEVFDPLMDGTGAFREIKSRTCYGTKDKETDEPYGVTVSVAMYEKARYVYTITFDKDMRCVGLYIK